MDLLLLHISHLEADERSLFAQHLNKITGNSKELKLFELISSDKQLSSEQIMQKIYKGDQSVAYHSLRKRLINRIYSFLMYRLMSDGENDVSNIPGTLQVCNMLINRQAFQLAIHYLQKAEKSAKRTRSYDMLDLLYQFMIHHAEALNFDIHDIIQRSLVNAGNLDIQRKLNFAAALIRHELQQARLNGQTLNPDMVTEIVRHELNLDLSSLDDPEFQFRIISIFRSGMISNKDYFELEPFILTRYNHLLEKNAFSDSDKSTQQGFLFCLAHAMYRNRKFTSAGRVLQAAGALTSEKAFRASPYYLKIISLQAAIDANSGRNTDAIALMNQHAEHIKKLNDSTEKFNMMLNTCVYYFNDGDYKAANRMMRETEANLNGSRKKMGPEWEFKRRMIHLIIRIEQESLAESDKMLQNLLKDYSQLFNHPAYERARIFLGFVKRYLQDPMSVTSADFRDEVRTSGLALPAHKEDLQAIIFFCWLLAKMQNRPYYVVLMERLAEGIDYNELILPADFEERYGMLKMKISIGHAVIKE